MDAVERLADKLIDRFGDNFSGVAVVLPGQRAGLYLKKALSSKMKSPVWAPAVYTLDDVAERVSGWGMAENVRLIFKLYRAYKDKSDEAIDFGAFLEEGVSLLADFNDIDMALADPDHLYKTLREYEWVAKHWSPETGKPELFNRFMGDWDVLPSVYHRFSELITGDKAVYRGKLYRKAVTNIEKGVVRAGEVLPDAKDIFIAGFNALTKAEKRLIDLLNEKAGAQVTWIIESKLLAKDDKTGIEQEAGRFIRAYLNLKDAEKSAFIFNRIEEVGKRIDIVGVNGSVAMARFAGQKLKSLEKKVGEMQNTAVILPDENLLIPVLESVPENITDFNVTIGRSLATSPWISFLEKILQLHINKERFSGKTRVYYYKDILAVLLQPVWQYHSDISKEGRELIQEMEKGRKLFWTVDELTGKVEGNSFSKVLFGEWDDDAGIAVTHLITLLEEFSEFINNPMDEQQLSMVQSALVSLRSIFEEKDFDVKVSVEALKKLLAVVIAPIKIHYSGEPLKGLQIMGLLETRMLGFKNIIVLSANEGIIPTAKKQESMIPFELKKEFGIPTYDHRDALYAYHFMHLVAGAENATILYNTMPDPMNHPEESRFLKQVKYEWKIWNDRIETTELSARISSDNRAGTWEKLRKNKYVLDNIREYLTSENRGLSPSALNTWLQSELDFYYGSVLRISEEMSDLEVLEHNQFGNFVHKILELIYRNGQKGDFKSYVLTVDQLEQARKNLDKIIEQAIEEEKIVPDSGAFVLAGYAAQNYIERYLKKEINDLKRGDKVTILGLELKVQAEIGVVIDGREKKVQIKGLIDRVEDRNGELRIVDYKTGNVDKTDLKLDMEKNYRDQLKEKHYVTQLLFYALLAESSGCEMFKKYDSFICGILTIRKIKDGILSLNIKKDHQETGLVDRDVIADFRKFVSSEISRMVEEGGELKVGDNYTYSLFSE